MPFIFAMNKPTPIGIDLIFPLIFANGPSLSGLFSLTSCCHLSDDRVLRFLRQKNKRPMMSARPTKPPTAPPAIPPTLVWPAEGRARPCPPSNPAWLDPIAPAPFPEGEPVFVASGAPDGKTEGLLNGGAVGVVVSGIAAMGADEAGSGSDGVDAVAVATSGSAATSDADEGEAVFIGSDLVDVVLAILLLPLPLPLPVDGALLLAGGGVEAASTAAGDVCG